jgi:hypothetical protein
MGSFKETQYNGPYLLVRANVNFAIRVTETIIIHGGKIIALDTYAPSHPEPAPEPSEQQSWKRMKRNMSRNGLDSWRRTERKYIDIEHKQAKQKYKCTPHATKTYSKHG